MAKIIGKLEKPFIDEMDTYGKINLYYPHGDTAFCMESAMDCLRAAVELVHIDLKMTSNMYTLGFDFVCRAREQNTFGFSTILTQYHSNVVTAYLKLMVSFEESMDSICDTWIKIEKNENTEEVEMLMTKIFIMADNLQKQQSELHDMIELESNLLSGDEDNGLLAAFKAA